MLRRTFFIIILSIALSYSYAFAGSCWNGGSSGSSPWSVLDGEGGSPSVEYADVNYCVNTSSSAGDTVNVPAGSATWTSRLTIADSIILSGAGIDSTTITNNYGNYIIYIEPSSPEDDPLIKVSGFTFDGNDTYALIMIKNENSTYDFTNFRIYNNKFKDTYNSDNKPSAIYTRGMVFGLIDNNIFDNNYYHINTRGYDTHSWDKYTKAGDNTLVYSSLGMGGARFLFIEDNTISGSANFFVVSGEGSRWVARYNNIDGGTTASLFDIHGDTLNDGCVAVELYENTEYDGGADASMGLADYRGGTAMIYNNLVDVLAPGLRTSVKVREETNPCDTAHNGYNMKVHNGYIWNNKNTYPTPDDPVYVQHHLQTDYDPNNCLTEKTDYWTDTQDGILTLTDYFTYDVAANRPGACSDDDVYWETDTKKLYRCDGDNNWTFIYSPYTYPHPLRGEQNNFNGWNPIGFTQ